jgi:hypothetical protein
LVGNSKADDSVKKLGQEQNIPVIEHQSIKRYREPEQFSHSQIPREELVAMVMNMPINLKSPGMDKVTTKVIKLAYPLVPSL